METDARGVLKDVTTPYYLMDAAAVAKEAALLEDALTASWGDNHIRAYSVKTNATPALLSFLKEQGFYAEIVSAEEGEIAAAAGFTKAHIVYNGPIKEETLFAEILTNGGFVNIDSHEEIGFLERLCKAHPDKKFRVGIRGNADPALISPEDVPADEEGSRFGFCYENGMLGNAIEAIRAIPGAELSGLHLHMSTTTRSVEWYEGLARLTLRIREEYELQLNYVDIGGGFYGGVPGKPTYADYIPAIATVLKEALKPEDVTLIVEPGISLISSGWQLVTSVLDTKLIRDTAYVVTDGSRLFLNPQVTRREYPHHILYAADGDRETTSTTLPRQMICGHTCMEYDRLFEIKDARMLTKGDRIVYDRAGGYTAALAPPAFIRPAPPVYVIGMNGEVTQGEHFTN